MLSDTEIMVRVQAGETCLFAELVQRYRARLLRFSTSKLGNAADAEDLVQEAFLAAYHARDSYSPEFAFSTWVWTITLNLAARAVRKTSRDIARQRVYLSLNPVSNLCDPSLLAILKQEQLEQIDHWLAMIPEPQSDAVRLRFFGGLSYQEIALAMECTESGAKRRVKNGLLKLAELAETSS